MRATWASGELTGTASGRQDGSRTVPVGVAGGG